MTTNSTSNRTLSVTPFIRSPFTDLAGGLLNAQYYTKCGELELKMMECLEAYGLNRGNIKCNDLIEDFQECYTMRKQQLRTMVSVMVKKLNHEAQSINFRP